MKPMKKRTLIILTVVIIAVIGLAKLSDPLVLAKGFVALYGDRIEAECADSLKKPENIPAMDIDVYRKGEHKKIEFLLTASGLVPSSSYYGCYYSPDDVPLAFQDMRVKLVEDGHDRWVWSEKGDNRGATSKIRDKWYYFEASF